MLTTSNLTPPPPLPGTLSKVGPSKPFTVKFGDLFKSVAPVFEPRILSEANRVIDSDSGYMVNHFDADKRPVSKIFGKTQWCEPGMRYSLPIIRYTKPLKFAKFDTDGTVGNWDYVASRLLVNQPEIQALAKNGLQTMAREFSWEGRSVKVNLMVVVRTYISEVDELSPTYWHKDMWDYTLVVSMKDNTTENNPVGATTHTGGGLQTGKKFANCSDKPCQKTIEDHNYQKNGGFVFTNKAEMIHQGVGGNFVPGNTGEYTEKRLFQICVDEVI